MDLHPDKRTVEEYPQWVIFFMSAPLHVSATDMQQVTKNNKLRVWFSATDELDFIDVLIMLWWIDVLWRRK